MTSMFRDFQRTAIAVVGAIVFSTMFVGAAVGPAQAQVSGAYVEVQDRASA